MASCRANIRWPYCPFWSLRLRVRCWRSERTWDTQPGKWQKTWERQLFTPSTYRKASLWSAIQNKIFPRRTLILLPVELSVEILMGHPCASRIKQHFADTARWDFHEAGQPTFFFIDGTHTYEYCKNDSEKCFELCGGRGVFLWHDCNETHPGVVRFISEWRRQGKDIKRIAGTSIAYWKST